MKKSIQLQGATGSIGRDTIDLIRANPEKFWIKSISGGSNWKKLAEIANEFKPQNVGINSDEFIDELKNSIHYTCNILSGSNAIIEVAKEEYDVTIAGIAGIHGVLPAVSAMENSKIVGLANKETIICAWNLIKKFYNKIVPVDSEHSAIFQCMDSMPHVGVSSVMITASGGPFQDYSISEMRRITPEMACNHPKWKMGKQISVDSATLVNKGLEAIEVAKLFNLTKDQIEITVHKESIIHGMVNYIDGSSVAHLSIPHMRVPIAYALSYPERMQVDHPKLDLSVIKNLSFDAPDYERFPLLKIALDCLDSKDTKLFWLKSLNEYFVSQFLEEKISFLDISSKVEKNLHFTENTNIHSISDLKSLINQANEISKLIKF